MKSDNLTAVKIGIVSALLLLLSAGISFAANAVSDTENCLLCHRYPAMGRYDKTGRKRVFYVNDKKFAGSVHGKLKCKDCHAGLDKIPHTDVKEVDCSTECHLKEPSTNQEFSHANMIKKYEASVHGRSASENPKPFPEDLPTCKYCHDNRMYNPLSGGWGTSEALAKETLARCVGCHTNENWAHNFYAHFTHRMRQRRTQAEIIKLCTSCHEDREKMARHGLESIETYKDTFHWTQIKYGVKDAPDCLSCHVPVGFSTHDIRPRTDPVSAIYVANRQNTCSNQGGLQSCHPGATVEFAGGRVHAYGQKAQMMAGEKPRNMEDSQMALVIERAEADLSESEIFHYKVIQLIKLFYKVLIAGVIAFMAFHQGLDYFRIKRKHQKAPKAENQKGNA